MRELAAAPVLSTELPLLSPWSVSVLATSDRDYLESRLSPLLDVLSLASAHDLAWRAENQPPTAIDEQRKLENNQNFIMAAVGRLSLAGWQRLDRSGRSLPLNTTSVLTSARRPELYRLASERIGVFALRGARAPMTAVNEHLMDTCASLAMFSYLPPFAGSRPSTEDCEAYNATHLDYIASAREVIVETMAQHATLGVDAFVLAGHSLGAAVALAVSARLLPAVVLPTIAFAPGSWRDADALGTATQHEVQPHRLMVAHRYDPVPASANSKGGLVGPMLQLKAPVAQLEMEYDPTPHGMCDACRVLIESNATVDEDDDGWSSCRECDTDCCSRLRDAAMEEHSISRYSAQLGRDALTGAWLPVEWRWL